MEVFWQNARESHVEDECCDSPHSSRSTEKDWKTEKRHSLESGVSLNRRIGQFVYWQRECAGNLEEYIEGGQKRERE